MYLGVLVFCFSTKCQAPQIVIAIGRVIYQVSTLLVVIRMTIKPCQKHFSVPRKTGLNFFDFSFKSEPIKRASRLKKA